MSAGTMSVVIQFGFIPASFILRVNTRRKARWQSKRQRRKRLKRQARCGAARADRPAARRLLRRCVGAKKIVRLHRFFLHQISLESKLNGRQKVKGGNGSIHCLNLYVTHCLAHCLAHCLDHCLAHYPELLSELCPELLADFRIPKPPGCWQGIFSSLILNSSGCCG